MNIPPAQRPILAKEATLPALQKRSIALIACLTLAAGARLAGAATLTFSELPNQPVNGLTFQNITFGFTVGGLASTDAQYNSVALGSNTTLNLQAGTLEGNASGLLTLDFLQPLSDLTFDLARLTSQNLTGATISLFDSALTNFATTPVSVSRLVTFSEGQFAYHGGTPVKRAVLSFTPAAGPRFALDNLNTTIVPEPGTALFGAFLASVCATARTRRR